MGFLDPKEGVGQGWGTLGLISPCPIVIPIKTTEWLCKVAYLGKIEKLWMDDKWGKKLGLALLTNTTKLVEQQWITKKKVIYSAQKSFHFYKIWKKCLVGDLTSNFLEGLISTQIHNMSLWVEGTYHCTKELAIIILMFLALLY